MVFPLVPATVCSPLTVTSALIVEGRPSTVYSLFFSAQPRYTSEADPEAMVTGALLAVTFSVPSASITL